MSQKRIKNQKIIKVGNSFAITLDKSFFDRNQLKEGDPIIARYDDDNGTVTFAPPQKYKASSITGALTLAEKKAVYKTKIDPELKKWTDDFLEANAEAMKELANS